MMFIKSLIAATAISLSTVANAGAWVSFQCEFNSSAIALNIVGDRFTVKYKGDEWPVDGHFDRETGVASFVDNKENAAFFVYLMTIDNNLMVDADFYYDNQVVEGICSAYTGNF